MKPPIMRLAAGKERAGKSVQGKEGICKVVLFPTQTGSNNPEVFLENYSAFRVAAATSWIPLQLRLAVAI
ncbi:MAG: hypothetical protein VXZ35_10850, partial [Pseudomonadota bacterium]|nr:hypothetical protein [Pseudomonadota bacterium]